MSTDTDTKTKPNKIFGYEKQILTGRNPIENFFENVKGVFFGPLIWVRGKYLNYTKNNVNLNTLNTCN